MCASEDSILRNEASRADRRRELRSIKREGESMCRAFPNWRGKIHNSDPRVGAVERQSVVRPSPARGETCPTAAVTPMAAEVDQWLSRFGDALSRGDAVGARRAIRPGSASGATSSRSPGTSRPSRARVGVSEMLERTLGHTKPRGWHTTEEPTAADGVIEAWIAVRDRGSGGAGPCCAYRWPGVDAADRARGAQGPRAGLGLAPSQGASCTVRTRSG